jgi:glycerophosphoryl diester phosphodiesterase
MKGTGSIEPENTVGSISEAIKLGADQIEIDAQLTADHRVVVIHDEIVDRTTDGSGRVAYYTFEGIRNLDAGLGEKIPTLEEVIEVVKGKAILQIELKGRNVQDEVVRIVKKLDMVNEVVLTSFRHESVRRAKALEPKLRTGVLFLCVPIDSTQLAINAHANNLHPNVDYIDSMMVEAAHRSGLKVFVWNADTQEKAKEMLRYGVDGIGTNRLDLILPLIKS